MLDVHAYWSAFWCAAGPLALCLVACGEAKDLAFGVRGGQMFFCGRAPGPFAPRRACCAAPQVPWHKDPASPSFAAPPTVVNATAGSIDLTFK